MKVWTENSLYVFDAAAETVTRHNATDEQLRRDDEPISCLAVYVVAVGVPALLVLDLRGDGVLTFRETSPVVSVELDELSGSFDEQLAEYDKRDAERAERFETLSERMRREHY